MELPHIFVLHVREGYEDRAAHIDSMMARLGLPFEYILDGDKADLTPEILDRWFAGPMKCVQGATSCACKHLMACRQIISRGLPGALILEDDIVLTRRHEEVARHTIAELPAGRPAIISYEDTRLRFVPRSRRRKGQYLYAGDRDRFTGALYVNSEAARIILDEAEKTRHRLPYRHFPPTTSRRRKTEILLESSMHGIAGQFQRSFPDFDRCQPW